MHHSKCTVSWYPISKQASLPISSIWLILFMSPWQKFPINVCTICIAFAEVRVLWLTSAMKGYSLMSSSIPSLNADSGLQGGLSLLPILLSHCYFKPLQWPTGRASAVNICSLSTLSLLSTISSSILDLFEGVSFNSIAVKNWIIVWCMQKVSMVKFAYDFFCICHSRSHLCWRRGFCLVISNYQKYQVMNNLVSVELSCVTQTHTSVVRWVLCRWYFFQPKPIFNKDTFVKLFKNRIIFTSVKKDSWRLTI